LLRPRYWGIEAAFTFLKPWDNLQREHSGPKDAEYTLNQQWRIFRFFLHPELESVFFCSGPKFKPSTKGRGRADSGFPPSAMVFSAKGPKPLLQRK